MAKVKVKVKVKARARAMEAKGVARKVMEAKEAMEVRRVAKSMVKAKAMEVKVRARAMEVQVKARVMQVRVKAKAMEANKGMEAKDTEAKEAMEAAIVNLFRINDDPCVFIWFHASQPATVRQVVKSTTVPTTLNKEVDTAVPKVCLSRSSNRTGGANQSYVCSPTQLTTMKQSAPRRPMAPVTTRCTHLRSHIPNRIECVARAQSIMRIIINADLCVIGPA